MNRKATALVWMSVATLSLLLAACKSAPPDMDTQPMTPEPSPVDVSAQETPMAPDETELWKTKELDAVTAEAYRRGFLGDVYFDYDKYELRAEARNRLSKNAEFMAANPEFSYTIEGHCDERGTNEYNLALGDRRANGAKNYLATLGTSSGRLRTISYGEERSVCNQSEASCWQRNRRAHFVITGRM